MEVRKSLWEKQVLESKRYSIKVSALTSPEEIVRFKKETQRG